MDLVSTLIRPEGRMRHELAAQCYDRCEFQPSSDPKAGCDERKMPSDLLKYKKFQPSSDPKAGCDQFLGTLSGAIDGFNPHPTRRPDATMRFPSRTPPGYRFQPSSDPKAGCDCRWFRSRPAPGRGFNPHPTRRPDATRYSPSRPPTWMPFQPSSDPKAGCDGTSRAKSSQNRLFHLLSGVLSSSDILSHTENSTKSLVLPDFMRETPWVVWGANGSRSQNKRLSNIEIE